MREESIAIVRDQYKITHISVQPVKAADKPRREKPRFAQYLLQQIKEDRGTRLQCVFVGLMAATLVIVQLLIKVGVITSPVYL